MSFLNRLILNKQGRLPLVKPRTPSRFENAMPAETEPGTVPDQASPFSKPVIKDSPPPADPASSADVVSDNRQDPARLDQVEGIFTRPEKMHEPLNAGSVKKNKRTAPDSTQPRVRQDEYGRGHEEAEGILIERHYLKDTGESGNQRKSGLPKAESRPFHSQKNHRPQAGSPDSSVTVHIGKLEVRAIVEQKEKLPKKSPSRKPEMSLQEYLDKKNNRI